MIAFWKQALAYISGSSTALSSLLSTCSGVLVSSWAVGVSKFVFSFILLPVLVQSTFKCLDVWYLDNIV